MSLPSKHSPYGLSAEDEKRTITVGVSKKKGAKYVERTIEDRIDEAVKNRAESLGTTKDGDVGGGGDAGGVASGDAGGVGGVIGEDGDGDIEMVPIDDAGEVAIINEFINDNRNTKVYAYEDSMMDIVVHDEGDGFGLVSRGNTSYLVVDTNFVLSHLNIMNDLVRFAGEFRLQIIIPMMVMRELDGLKNSTRQNLPSSSQDSISRESIGHLARWANDWIYSALAENSMIVKGQKMKERIDKFATKDEAILDCCLFFQQKYPHLLVVLLSNDKNFCLKALANDILTVSYRKGMTAAVIAKTIYEENLRRHGTTSPPVDVGPKSFENRRYEADAASIQHQHLLKPMPNDINQVSLTVYNEVFTITRSIIHHCMYKNYGEDLDLVKNYDGELIDSLGACSVIFIRFWFTVFAPYFKQNEENFKPFREETRRSKAMKEPVHTSIPVNKTDLKQFVLFWSTVLDTLYQAEMSATQNEALGTLIERWKRMSSQVQ